MSATYRFFGWAVKTATQRISTVRVFIATSQSRELNIRFARQKPGRDETIRSAPKPRRLPRPKADARSLAGNHSEIALEEPGKPPPSPNPSATRNMPRPNTLAAEPCNVLASDHQRPVSPCFRIAMICSGCVSSRPSPCGRSTRRLLGSRNPSEARTARNAAGSVRLIGRKGCWTDRYPAESGSRG
jgi:hypothetical protein